MVSHLMVRRFGERSGGLLEINSVAADFKNYRKFNGLYNVVFDENLCDH